MKGRIEIDKERCKGCGFCVEACPLKLLKMSDSFNRAGYFVACINDPDRCTGCAICANICPDIAITVYRE
jgi:2-oxoglutarate ferredoxin oxidoreductase subunit delta